MVVSPRLPAFGAPLAGRASRTLPACNSLCECCRAGVFKDLNIRQRAMVDVAPPSLPSAGTSTAAGAGIVVNTAVDRSDARYRHGDSLTLSVDVNEDVYVWVFDTGTSGVHQIFPNRHDADNFVQADRHCKGADTSSSSRTRGGRALTIASKDSNPLTGSTTRRRPDQAIRYRSPFRIRASTCRRCTAAQIAIMPGTVRRLFFSFSCVVALSAAAVVAPPTQAASHT